MNPQIVGILTVENFSDYISDSVSASRLDELSNCRVLEFRGDTFLPEEVPEKLEFLNNWLEDRQIGPPEILLTLRLVADGGKWMSSPITRNGLWEKCLEMRLVNWIDLEMEEIHNSADFISEIHRSSSVKLMLSHHNFSQSYSISQFSEKLDKMELIAPDIVKFAVTLQSREDFLEMLNFSKTLFEKYPLSCLISMGIWGKLSRIASPIFGAPLTYGFLGDSQVVEGQYSVEKLHQFIEKIKESIPGGVSGDGLITLLEKELDE